VAGTTGPNQFTGALHAMLHNTVVPDHPVKSRNEWQSSGTRAKDEGISRSLSFTIYTEVGVDTRLYVSYV